MARRPSVDDGIAVRFDLVDLLSRAAEILSEPLGTPEQEAARAEAVLTRLLHGDDDDVGDCETLQ